MTTWILLRGLARESRHWGGFPAALQAAMAPASAPIVALDLPGSGSEHGRRVPLSVRGMVQDVRARAAAQGLAPPYRLVALSLGGMVATAWAQQHADEIEGLVLINTSMRPFGRPHERLRWQAWPGLLRALAHWQDAARCEALVHGLTCQRTDELDRDLRCWSAIRIDAPVSRTSALRQLVAAARFRAAPRAPACPVLILSSSGDRLVSPRCSARLAAHWRCTHGVHPAAGHDLPHDDAAWVAAQIQAWIRHGHG